MHRRRPLRQRRERARSELDSEPVGSEQRLSFVEELRIGRMMGGDEAELLLAVAVARDTLAVTDGEGSSSAASRVPPAGSGRWR